MKILVTNDDGIFAPGLWALVEAIKVAGEVLVIAPDREQSAVGTSITLHQPVRMKQVEPPKDGVSAYSVEGTPADCVILGLQMLAKDGVDLVISGINEGLNLGNDVFISGTVGAALQGNFYDVPSVAISAALVDNQVRFDAAARFGELLVRKVQQKSLYHKTLLNVNVPSLPLHQISGIELTRLGRRRYRDEVEKGNDGKRDYYWIVRGEAEWEEMRGTDFWATENKKISVTPLRGNLANPTRLSSLENLVDALFLDLQSPGC